MPVIESLLMVGGVAVHGVASLVLKRGRATVLVQVARRGNGTFKFGGVFGDPQAEIATSDGIKLVVTMGSQAGRKWTRCEADLPGRTLPTFHVVPKKLEDRVWKVFGMKDIEVGAPGFDDNFIVQGEDDAAVRRVWSKERAFELVLASRRCEVHSVNKKVSLEKPTKETVEDVERTIQMLLALTRYDAFGLRALGTLPEATLVVDEHGFTQAEVPGPTRIVVGPWEHDKVTRTRVEIVAASSVVSEPVRRRIEQLGAMIELEPELTRIVWPSIETDRERLLGAVEILRQLTSATSVGAFR